MNHTINLNSEIKVKGLIENSDGKGAELYETSKLYLAVIVERVKYYPCLLSLWNIY